MGTALEILIILLLVLLNGAFAMSELAIVSSRRSRLMAMQKRGVRGADTALALADDPQRFLPTVQVGITMVGIIAGAFGGARPGWRVSQAPAAPVAWAPIRPGSG